ncbi:unnamed protein product, partial [Staurois parvus]
MWRDQSISCVLFHCVLCVWFMQAIDGSFIGRRKIGCCCQERDRCVNNTGLSPVS